jgi:hypothetical protein
MGKNHRINPSWGILSGISGIVCFYSTAFVVVLFLIFSQITAQTTQKSTLFDSWYQTLLFVVSVASFLSFVGCFIMFLLKKHQKKTMAKEETVHESL